MKNDIRHFFKACLIILLSLVAIDLCAGFVFDSLFLKLPLREKLPSAISHSYRDNPDIVLIGSSRCHHHIVTRQFADSINLYSRDSLSAYNFGLDAVNVNSHLCAIESMLSRYTPRLIILEMGSHEFGKAYTRSVECASPLYRHDSVVRRYINQADARNRLVMLSSMYRYRNAMPLRMAEVFLAHPDGNLGYSPLFRVMDTAAIYDKGDSPNEFSPDSVTVSNFRRVARMCKERGILLVAVESPRYKAPFFPNFADTLCRGCGVPFFDFRSTDFFDSHYQYFYEPAHLNHEGATLFTGMLFEKIKPFLQ